MGKWGPYTAKSSLIAAMADLDLKEFQSNSRSILVIEDVVTSFESMPILQVALSALLKFVDGLWSSSGDGRILVMTTDYKDHIDPVPLRPSCMDMQFHLSSHTFSGFKMLLNHLKGITYLRRLRSDWQRFRQHQLKFLGS